MPSNSLPLKRKERSLSLLVVSTPKVSIQAGLTGKRTKSAGRKATGLRGTSFTMKESIKKEEDAVENFPEGSQSPGSLNEIGQDVKQTSKRDLEGNAEPRGGNVDLWKPLNCLVEAANRTKIYKVNSQGSCLAKLEPLNADDGEKHLLINKVKEINHKYKDFTTMVPTQFKHKRLRVLGRKSGGVGFPAMSQTVIDSTVAKQSRRNCPFWFSLVASEPQRGNVHLPQISSCYLRIKWRYHARVNLCFQLCNFTT